MKIVNLSPVSFPEEKDPEAWIQKSYFLKGIWEAVSKLDQVIFIDFIGFEGKIQRNGAEYWFFKRSKKALRLPLDIHRAIAMQQPDVVIVHGMHFPVQVLLLRKVLGGKCRIVVQDHGGGYIRNPLKKLLQKAADRMVDAYFFSAVQQAAVLLQGGIIRDSRKIREVPEVSSVFGQQDRKRSVAFTGVSGRDAYIWVGHLQANKDPMLAIAAFTAFASEAPDAALYLVFQSDDLLPEIQLWLKHHPAAARSIHLVGKVPHADLEYWYSSVDFIISTSRYEAGGVSVAEAMSCGCIPLLSDIPAFQSLLRNSCGALFEQGSSAALLQLLHDSSMMDKAKERQRVQVHFEQYLSFKAIGQHIHDVLQVMVATE